MKHILLSVLVIVIAGTAQPPAPAGDETPCHPNPTGTTYEGDMDCEGFVSIFNGENFDGWFHSCQTNHSNPDPANGAIWKVDAENQAMYSNQRANGAGSIMMTNKVYVNYDIKFDFWPDFGNDAGVFNRTNATGRCEQIVLDYINGSSVGGHWSEAGWSGSPTWIPPFKMGANEETIKDRESWSFTGEWSEAWDPNDWNHIKVQTFGFPPTVQTWMKKITSEEWIEVLAPKTFGSEVNNEPREGYIGLQVHANSGRWGGRKGNWYRNIFVRELDDEGNIAANPPAPMILVEPFLSGEVTAGEPIDITVTVQPNANPKCDDLITYQWMKDGTPINGANSAVLNIPAVSATDEGSYTVEISNPVGTNKAVSQPVAIALTSTAPYEVNIPGIELIVNHAIQGKTNQDYSLEVFDVKGNLVSGFSGGAGDIYHALPESLSGVMFVKLYTASYNKKWKVFLQ